MDQPQKTEVKAHASHATAVEAKPSHQKKECPTRNGKCYKCGKKGHFKGSCRSKKEEKEMGKARNTTKSEIGKSQQAEGISNSRDMNTAAIWSAGQHISTKENPESDILPHANSASKQPQ